MLVSEARTEKKLEDSRADYQAKKLREKNNELIKYYESKIEEEKEAIKECLDANFFSIAKTKIHRIEEMIKEINSLR